MQLCPLENGAAPTCQFRRLPGLLAYDRIFPGRQIYCVDGGDKNHDESFHRPLAAAATIPFIRRMNGPYRVLKGVPTNIVIDRRGIVRYAQAGGFSLDGLNALLVPLLRQQPQAPVSIPTLLRSGVSAAGIYLAPEGRTLNFAFTASNGHRR